MFLSYKFSDAKRNYHVTERKILAGIRCMEETSWLWNGGAYNLLWYTDHRAIIDISKNGDTYGRVARWQYRLSKFNFEVIHVPRKDNTLADGLSRLHLGTTLPEYDPTLLAFIAETTKIVDTPSYRK